MLKKTLLLSTLFFCIFQINTQADVVLPNGQKAGQWIDVISDYPWALVFGVGESLT